MTAEDDGTVPAMDFVVVTYNSLLWIGRLLRSIEDRAGPAAYSVTVVDNGSHDGTADLVAREFPWVRLIANEENRWLSPALNQGIKEGTARHVTVMNPDCELRTDDWVGRVVRFMAISPSIGVLAPRLLNEDGSVQYSGRPERSRWWALKQALGVPSLRSKLGLAADERWEPEWQRDTLRDVGTVSGACMVFPRHELERLGMFDGSFRLFHEEDDICRRFHLAGLRVILFPDVEVMHAWSKSVSQVPIATIRLLHDESFLRYSRKYYGRGFERLLKVARRMVGVGTAAARRWVP